MKASEAKAIAAKAQAEADMADMTDILAAIRVVAEKGKCEYDFLPWRLTPRHVEQLLKLGYAVDVHRAMYSDGDLANYKRVSWR